MTDNSKPLEPSDLDPEKLRAKPGTLRPPMVYAWAKAFADFFYSSVEETEPAACPTQIEILAAARLLWRTMLLDANEHIESCDNPGCPVDEEALMAAHELADEIAQLVQHKAQEMMALMDDTDDEDFVVGFPFGVEIPEA